VASRHRQLFANAVMTASLLEIETVNEVSKSGTRLDPDQYQNSRPLRDGSLTRGSFFELDLFKQYISHQSPQP
jgi:hypothetical protein